MSSTEREVGQARHLFRLFHGREPRANELAIIDPPRKPIVLLEIGNFIQVRYQAKGSGEFFEHDFERPFAKLYATYDGGQVYAIGGGYRFTAKGFVR